MTEASGRKSRPTKRAAVMQPYLFPYVGYFQLIQAVDTFVVYDEIKYTKKGWINRNRLLLNGHDSVFTLPLKRASDALDICDREVAADFSPIALMNKIAGAYRRAPYFRETFPLIEQIVFQQERRLFAFIRDSIVAICDHLAITVPITPSSAIAADRSLKGQARVIALCEALGADVYVNPIGGIDLYSAADFRDRGIELKFLQSQPFAYPQFGGDFVPSLSIIDVLMFNSAEDVGRFIKFKYELI